MKKVITYFLIVSMLFLCSCQADNLNSSEIKQSSEISTVKTDNINETSSVVDSDDENISIGDNVNNEIQNQKTIINVNSQTAKMCFASSNDTISKIPKEYAVEKISKFEKYTKSNVQNKTVNILGVEYKDIPYYQSEKNQYTGREYDDYRNENVKFSFNNAGIIDFFSPKYPIKFFNNESQPTEELAKKYLEIILPDYKYDIVLKKFIEFEQVYLYRFYKSIDGIRTSDGISITLTVGGALESYSIHDLYRYDGLEIDGVNKEVLQERIEDYVNEAYGEVMTDYGISEEGPYYNIFVDDKLELSFPIWVKVKTEEGYEYTITEVVVFELN